MYKEKTLTVRSGLPVLGLLLLGKVTLVAGIITTAAMQPAPELAAAIIIPCVLGILTHLVLLGGLFTVSPNEGRVLQLFGRYIGTCRDQGLHWANPFFGKRSISLKVRNFESEKLKVNDQAGNPIEIAAVVVWKVLDTAEACFHVDDYEDFVHVQSEAAVRNLAGRYPYDAHDDGKPSLRSSAASVFEQLKHDIQDRLSEAGVEVIEARLTHLAYAPEIAAAMLRRQQADAVISARTKIVEGAVGMVESALHLLSKNQIVQLDEERKAAMVSNLLVVLCSDRDTQPVVNAGTLYS